VLLNESTPTSVTPTVSEHAVNLCASSTRLDDDRSLLEFLPNATGCQRFAFVRHGEGMVGWGTAAAFAVGSGVDRFVQADEALQDFAETVDVRDEVRTFGSGLVAFGSFTFDALDASSVLVIPEVIIGRRHGVTWRTIVREPNADAVEHRPDPQPDEARLEGQMRARDVRPRFGGSSLTDKEWLETVGRVLEAIDSGVIEKLVLARDQRIWARSDFELVALLQRLSQTFPSCSTFMVDGLIGASPELLLRRQGTQVASQVLAGTTGRGSSADEDRSLADLLLRSEKDLHEHKLAIDSVVNELAGHCSHHTVSERPELLKLDNVQHLASRFTGHLHDSATSLRLLSDLHPTAAVAGTPRENALALIRDIEGMQRGRYAGPVGWTAPSGDGEWAIALRCGQFDGSRARLFAGAGVVTGSIPLMELEEVWMKLRAMQETIGPE